MADSYISRERTALTENISEVVISLVVAFSGWNVQFLYIKSWIQIPEKSMKGIRNRVSGIGHQE